MKSIFKLLGLSQKDESILEQYQFDEKESKRWENNLDEMSISDLNSTLSFLRDTIEDYQKKQNDDAIADMNKDFVNVELQKTIVQVVTVKTVIRKKLENVFV